MVYCGICALCALEILLAGCVSDSAIERAAKRTPNPADTLVVPLIDAATSIGHVCSDFFAFHQRWPVNRDELVQFDRTHPSKQPPVDWSHFQEVHFLTTTNGDLKVELLQKPQPDNASRATSGKLTKRDVIVRKPQ